MYNSLYNTPIEHSVSTSWFHGCEQAACMGRTCIITASGVFYAAVCVGENRLKIVRSIDAGYSWQTMHIFEDLYVSEGTDGAGTGGIAAYLEWSETDSVLYLIYIDVIASGDYAGDRVPYLYDVTNEAGIGFIGEGTFDCQLGRFAAAGHIDRKLMLAWSDTNDGNIVKATLVDIHHYNSGVRDMVLAAGGTVTTGEAANGGPQVQEDLGLFDISEDDGGWNLWWVRQSNGRVKGKRITYVDTQEDVASNANFIVWAPQANDVFIEIFGCEDGLLVTKYNSAPANNSCALWSNTRGNMDQIDVGHGTTHLAEGGGGTYDYYAWLQMIFVRDGGVWKFQVFSLGRNAGDNRNLLETSEVVRTTAVQGTRKLINEILVSPWIDRDKCFCVFEGPSKTVIEQGGRGAVLVAIGNGTPEGFGHRTGDCSVYTEWLVNQAYPLTISSSYFSTASADYYSGGDIGRNEKQANMAFEKAGLPLLILKYEVVDPSIRSGVAYILPVEIEIKGFINELSLKNPTNIRLEESEEFTSVLEKDIRQLYFPASTYLGRTYMKSRRGFVMRTVYLLKFYGRFYEVTQVVPVFGKNGIICNKANLYVCGASYDPFTRRVLPNEV